MEFNKTVHQSDDHGDPVRNDDGSIRLKTNWKDVARDHKGRSFNPILHGERAELDDSGFLKMRRRDEARKPMTATNKSESFVAKYRENGYAYYLVADEPGRLDQFRQHDWEPVLDANKGVANMSGGRGNSPALVLHRKPEEWYDADQKEKDRLLNVNLESKTKPTEDQYGTVDLKADSPLR